jgi:thioesterase domain-containing protein
MSEAAVNALDNRVTRLEGEVANGLRHIESLILREIAELKNEALADIKRSLDRVEGDLRKQIDRIADDQRRLWDRLTGLENRENQRIGAGKARGSAWHVFSAMIGGLLTVAGTAVMNWLGRGGPPPVH